MDEQSQTHGPRSYLGTKFPLKPPIVQSFGKLEIGELIM